MPEDTAGKEAAGFEDILEALAEFAAESLDELKLEEESSFSI